MCLVLIAVNPTPELRLIIAANRDEAHDRPTDPAHRWAGNAGIIAGRDREAGGTWLGVSENGRVAAVTNFREVPTRPGTLSRGALVTDFLEGNGSAAEFAARLAPVEMRYGGYNLVLHDGNDTWCASNRGPNIRLDSGFHGLSNHLVNTPWPKVKQTLRGFEHNYDNPEDMWTLLADRTEARDNDLPQTGLPLALERKVSATFIVDELYGTRCSTWLSISHQGVRQIQERSFDATGSVIGHVSFEA